MNEKIDTKLLKEVKKNGNGCTSDQSKALAQELKEAQPAKAERKKEKLTARIAVSKRNDYQKRKYLHPSYNAPEWADKEPSLIALKTLYIDANGEFHLWNSESSLKLISEWIKAEHVQEFTTADIMKKFKLFGGGIGDVTRSACNKLKDQGVLSVSKQSHGKKERYLFKVISS